MTASYIVESLLSRKEKLSTRATNVLFSLHCEKKRQGLFLLSTFSCKFILIFHKEKEKSEWKNLEQFISNLLSNKQFSFACSDCWATKGAKNESPEMLSPFDWPAFHSKCTDTGNVVVSNFIPESSALEFLTYEKKYISTPAVIIASRCRSLHVCFVSIQHIIPTSNFKNP